MWAESPPVGSCDPECTRALASTNRALNLEAERQLANTGWGSGLGLQPGDDSGQRFGAAGDGALGVGHHQNLALDGRLVRLRPVVADLDDDLLLQRPLDVLPPD